MVTWPWSCHNTVTVLSCLSSTIYKQPSGQGIPYWCVPGNTWHSRSTENSYGGERGHFGEKPSGLHQLQLVPTRTELKVNWHQLNLLTLNSRLWRNRSEGNFGIHMASMKITPLCTYMQQQCRALTTGTNTGLCQHMTQKRRRRRRWKNRPKEGKAAERKAIKKQQRKQLCSEGSVCDLKSVKLWGNSPFMLPNAPNKPASHSQSGQGNEKHAWG